MKKSFSLCLSLLCLLLLACSNDSVKSKDDFDKKPIRLQLNWFHDPTFSGEYKAKELMGDGLLILEGGVNISPIQKVKAGIADIAVVGLDIALKAIDSDINRDGKSPIRVIFVDLQRNPVGWIIHPKTAEKYGMPDNLSGAKKNEWLFKQFKNGNIAPGDKRGTETTAVWVKWRNIHKLRGVNVTGVGFDPTIMLDAPDLAYPVYMNEEPYKLEELVGSPMIVFDPADDGIELYGNVIITIVDNLESEEYDINNFLEILSGAWVWVKDNQNQAFKLVRKYYPDVSEDILKSQIKTTVDFVFYQAISSGEIDLRAEGRLDQTIQALKSAGSISQKFDSSEIKKYVIPFSSREQ